MQWKVLSYSTKTWSWCSWTSSIKAKNEDTFLTGSFSVINSLNTDISRKRRFCSTADLFSVVRVIFSIYTKYRNIFKFFGEGFKFWNFNIFSICVKGIFRICMSVFNLINFAKLCSVLANSSILSKHFSVQFPPIFKIKKQKSRKVFFTSILRPKTKKIVTLWFGSIRKKIKKKNSNKLSLVKSFFNQNTGLNILEHYQTPS